jgi:F-type H+-transporting ATPase subunit epsilon
MRYEYIKEVTSFVGEDSSGSFGILAGHDRLITNLIFGLARFKTENGPWQYLAMPGAMLYFTGNELNLNTRRYLKSDNYETISQALVDILTQEERDLQGLKRSLRLIEENILRRLMVTENQWRAP